MIRGLIDSRLRADGRPEGPLSDILNFAVAKAVGLLLETNLKDVTIEDRKVVGHHIIEENKTEYLHLGLKGPENGPGLLSIAGNFSAQLVSLMATGSTAKVLDRTPTATDAKIVTKFFEIILDEIGATLSKLPHEVWAVGHQVHGYISDIEKFANEIPKISFRKISVALKLDEIDEDLKFAISLPAEPQTQQSIELGQRKSKSQIAWQKKMQSHVLDSKIPLTAVIARSETTIAEIHQWGAGTLIPLPHQAEAQIALVAGSKVVAEGKIGMKNEQKALRLLWVNGQNPAEDMASASAGSFNAEVGDAVPLAATNLSDTVHAGDELEDWGTPETATVSDEPPEMAALDKQASA